MSTKAYTFKENRPAFLLGMRHGVPIGLGYFAVAFSLGIAAKKAGLIPIQGFLTSILCHASAGEYMGFTMIAAGAGYFETALAIFVANARYLLMSTAMSQRLASNLPFAHRILLGFGITDELFAVSVMRQGYLNPYYTYGATVVALPSWALGTMLGILAGNLMPAFLVSAFGVALYGMFLAVIVPPARQNKVILALIPICFALSFAAGVLPFVKELSAGTRTILLTVVIASGAALLFPVKEEQNEE